MDIQDKSVAERLLKEAHTMLEYSYSPYSDFKVGAALLTVDGKLFTGCNIENATYGATNCAERTAIFKAVSEGYKDFAAIAIVSSGGGLTFPCGICRQVMAEFSPAMLVILEDENNRPAFYTLSELLPCSFTL